ncbi:MAG: magnesium chelatase ATPase subunit D, partial [Rhodoferax sp.]|nr:magnesium chelatase ATPase subunit D [Rhodoferax sp.]
MTLSGQASTVAALMAVDPVGLGGVALRARASLARDQWLQMLRQLLPSGLPFRRVPLHVDDSRLLGGLDLAATLRRGRPVAQTGLLAQSDGGVAVLASAERLGNATAARLAQVLDTGEAVMERNGLSLRHAARLGLVALDEGSTDDEQLSGKLLDRMAFHLHLADATDVDSLVAPPGVDAAAIVAARALLPQVLASEAVVQALCDA